MNDRAQQPNAGRLTMTKFIPTTAGAPGLTPHLAPVYKGGGQPLAPLPSTCATTLTDRGATSRPAHAT